MNPSSPKRDATPGVDALIALKRRESPPDEFFASFSDRVIARIEAERGVARYMGAWKRFRRDVDAGLVFAGAYAAFILALFVGAYLFSARTLQSPSVSNILLPDETLLLGFIDDASDPPGPDPMAETPLATTPSSMAPVVMRASYPLGSASAFGRIVFPLGD